MNSRLFSIIRKEFIQIIRDMRTLVIILIIPIMQLFLLGYSATNDVRNVPLAVFDQCRCPESRSLLDAYRAADYFKLAYAVGSEDEIRSLIEQGKARAGIIIPPDYNPAWRRGMPRWPSSWMVRMPPPVPRPFGRHPDRAVPGHPVDDPRSWSAAG